MYPCMEIREVAFKMDFSDFCTIAFRSGIHGCH